MSSRALAPLNGTRKAAILMAIMGDDAASAICRHLPDKDVQAVTRELADMGSVPADLVHEVLEEYSRQASTQDNSLRGGPEYAKRLLVKAFGDDGAKDLWQKVAQMQTLNADQVEAIQKAEPGQLAKFLETEHPQTIALVLAHLDGKKASALLMKLSEQVRSESVKRLAQLRQFSPEMAQRVSTVLSRRLQGVGEQSRKNYAGFKSVADVMNQMDAASSKAILETIERDDPKLAIDIRNLMFTFEDLLGVPDVAIREWLGTMDKKSLAMALKGASNDLKEHIFRAMSSRAVEMLKEDMEALGPVRGKDVTAAQQEAVTALRKLEAEGKVVLRAEGDDEYVV